MAPDPFQYAVLRLVPRIEREEFVNVGVIVFCRTRGFLRARVALDPRRIEALAPGFDLETVREHLEARVRVAAGDPDAGPIAHTTAIRALSLARGAVEHGDPDLGGSQRSVRGARGVLDRLFEQLVAV